MSNSVNNAFEKLGVSRQFNKRMLEKVSSLDTELVNVLLDMNHNLKNYFSTTGQ